MVRGGSGSIQTHEGVTPVGTYAHLCSPDTQTLMCLDSAVGLGMVLSQGGEDGQELVLGFASCMLTKPESNYCLTCRELLAVVFRVQKYQA